MVQAPGSYHNFTTSSNNTKLMSQAACAPLCRLIPSDLKVPANRRRPAAEAMPASAFGLQRLILSADPGVCLHVMSLVQWMEQKTALAGVPYENTVEE